ncbi:hypothetical protein O181_063415 [Austropuccinia psidii MF-1]|uniref:Reverse transcriptase domain-containing protein n=1 Tax=Austropuccinia psidii MF-1 TaxID=1389203 RepID=A0A9Q3ER85_9BASI|nr:hypothetical protein [Austropuccinia psidii MF-1]
MDIYEYTRMPFGFKNAPSHFQRMMDKIFQDEILEGWMAVYIDDIIIYSETWEDHVQYIDRVLSKCTPINLKNSLKKCNFGQQELLPLGHKYSVLSLAIEQNKVAAELKMPVPRNIKEMQSVLGFASCYRNHIKRFAHMTSSLYKLCSKDVVFEITKERRVKNEKIKNELTNAPVLILPDFELPFKLYIDTACSQGLPGALHWRQIVDGEPTEGVICSISRQLKDSEVSQPQRMTLLDGCCRNSAWSQAGANWSHHVFYCQLAPFGLLWPQAISWPIPITPTPRPLYTPSLGHPFSLGGLGPKWPFWAN